MYLLDLNKTKLRICTYSYSNVMLYAFYGKIMEIIKMRISNIKIKNSISLPIMLDIFVSR